MNSNVFKNIIEPIHKRWLSTTLDMYCSHSTGIDLLHEQFGVELKSKLDTYTKAFAVHEYQIQQFKEDNKDKELYWAFMLYSLDRPISKIQDEDSIAQHVTDRTVWFIEWDWINQFPSSSGTKTGEYVYVKTHQFPSKENFIEKKLIDGTLYIPQFSQLLQLDLF